VFAGSKEVSARELCALLERTQRNPVPLPVQPTPTKRWPLCVYIKGPLYVIRKDQPGCCQVMPPLWER